jgi:hypothetical protein
MASQNRTHASDRGKAVVDIPGIPTIGTATAAPESATVAFTANVKGGAALSWTALSNPGSITGTGSSSPVTVSGLTVGTSYTFTVQGSNSTGTGEYSVASNSAVPIASTSYESIATIDGTGSSGTVTFSSIPSTYKHLQLRITAVGNAGAGGYPTSLAYFRLNSDSGSNYYFHTLSGNGSSASSSNGTSTGDFFYLPGGNTSYHGVVIIDILDYASTSKTKVLRALNGTDRNGSGAIWINSMLWNSTSAITNISLQGDASFHGSWTAGSKFALYGIKG